MNHFFTSNNTGWTQEEIDNGLHLEWLKDSGMDQYLTDTPPNPDKRRRNQHPPSSNH